MGFTVWLCVLCLQASLLSHAIDCSGGAKEELCVSGPTADGQHDDKKQQNMPPVKEALISFRRKRQLDQRGHTHLSHSSLPGTVSVRGFPNTLIQVASSTPLMKAAHFSHFLGRIAPKKTRQNADRSRRHLVQSANKRKNKRKSRVGSFSLLTNDKKSNPLLVIRAKRQAKTDPPKRGGSGHAGALSVLGYPQNDGQNDRPKRNIQTTSTAK